MILAVIGDILLLAIGSAVFPALLAGAAVILSREHPEWLLVAFWLGGLLTSVTAGIVIVSLFGVQSESLSEGGSGLSPFHSLVAGVAVLLLAALLGTARGNRLISEWRRRRSIRRPEGPERAPWAERFLDHGSIGVAGIAGAILNLPGPFYLIALSDIAKAGWGSTGEVVAILAFNIVMFTLVELPIVGYLLAPDRTDAMVSALSGWLNRNGLRVVAAIALAGGGGLVWNGIQGLLEPQVQASANLGSPPASSSASYSASSLASSSRPGKKRQTSADPIPTASRPTT